MGTESARPSSTSSSREILDSDTSALMGDRDDDGEVWETKIKTCRIPELTALHLAVSMGLARIASLLLKETTNVDAVDENGKTPFVLALERGFEKAIEFLINSGASVDLRNASGRGLLLLMSERSWYNAGDAIVEKARLTVDEDKSGRSQDRIHFLLAAYGCAIDELARLGDSQWLQLTGIDRDIAGAALFLSIEKQSKETVEALLAIGVDVDSRDDLGQTALHRATRRKSEDVMKLLLRNGANVDRKDDDYHVGILRILLDAGADPSTRGQQGVSELYTAAKDGDVEIVKYMLESGTDPSIQTMYGWAPLRWAASYGYIGCVRLLLEAGADPDVISDQDVTPLDLATRADQSIVIGLLRDAGAKLFEQTGTAARRTVDKAIDIDISSNTATTPNKSPAATLANQASGFPTEKIRLVYDKPLARTLFKASAVGRYAYPSGTTGAANDIYEVSHFLETESTAICIRRSTTRAEMSGYSRADMHFDVNDMLYEVAKVKTENHEFQLSGRHQNPLASTMTMHKHWTGGWKVRHDSEGHAKAYLLRTTPEWSSSKDEDSRWMLENGLLQARSGWDDATPWISIEMGVERQMQDLIVTCWITKLWSETAALQRQD
ncbi:MAG: hypothetical protein Q9222_001191 [Ikaeria aurantiellina]